MFAPLRYLIGIVNLPILLLCVKADTFKNRRDPKNGMVKSITMIAQMPSLPNINFLNILEQTQGRFKPEMPNSLDAYFGNKEVTRQLNSHYN